MKTINKMTLEELKSVEWFIHTDIAMAAGASHAKPKSKKLSLEYKTLVKKRTELQRLIAQNKGAQ